MSRFINLEFNDEHGEHDQGQSSRTKDEAFYVAEAQVAFANGDFEKALRQFSKVLEFNPQNTAAWSGQVRMLIELGEFREARLWADKALERFPSDPDLLAAKAVALGRSGDLDEALAFSDAAIEERGDTPYIWLARADVLLARKEQRADYCFDKALALAPGEWFVPWLAARVRRFYKQFALALKLLQQALESNADHFLLWLEAGQCQLAMGLIGPAEKSFAFARELNPLCADASRAIHTLSQTGVWARLRSHWLQFFRP